MERSRRSIANLPLGVMRTAGSFIARNPLEIARALRSLTGMRVGVHLDLLRWLASEAEKSGKAQNITLDPIPPGIKVGADIDAMKTPVRVSAQVFIDHIQFDASQLRLEIRLEDVQLTLRRDAATPVAMLIKSGALDLTRPGELVKHLPKLPAFVSDASGNRIVLNLMKHPAIRNHNLGRTLVSAATSIVTLHGVQTDTSHLDIAFKAIPRGLWAVGAAAAQVTSDVRTNLKGTPLGDSLRHLRRLLPL